MLFRSTEWCQVDVWSLGATLFNLVVGRPPWVAQNQIVLAHQIQHVELVFPPEAEDLDPHLKNLLRRMLTKDPDRRISLEEVVNHEWVTNEGSDPLPDFKTQRPLQVKQQVQVTEYEVEQAVIMPPSVLRYVDSLHDISNCSNTISSRLQFTEAKARSRAKQVFTGVCT